MKKNLTTLAFLCLVAFYGCKKDSKNPDQSKIQIDVSGLTDKTSLSIKVTDNTTGGDAVLNLTNQFGNKTYYSSSVNPGDKILVHVSSNVNDNVAGDGDGLIKLSYKGQSLGAHGGTIGIAGFDINATIPNQ